MPAEWGEVCTTAHFPKTSVPFLLLFALVVEWERTTDDILVSGLVIGAKKNRGQSSLSPIFPLFNQYTVQTKVVPMFKEGG